MLFYSLVIALSTFLAYVGQKIKEVGRKEGLRNKYTINAGGVLLFLSFLVLFLVSALRYNVGTDFNSYTSWFYLIASGEETYFEPSFAFIMHALPALTTNAQWLFVVSALLTIGLVYIAIKKYSINPALSVFLFSTMSFYFASFNGIRQFIAVAIILMAFNLLLKRRALLYIGSVLIASTFHQSALIMIPAYFLFGIRPSVSAVGAVTVLSGIAIYFREDFLQWVVNIYPMYAKDDDFLYRGFSLSEVMIATSFILMIVIIVLFKKRILDRQKKEDRVVFNTAFFSLILHTLLSWIPAINRLTLYIDIAFILIIPFLLAKVKDRTWRVVLTISIMLLYAVYIYISIGINNSHNVLPYRSVFDASGSLSMGER